MNIYNTLLALKKYLVQHTGYYIGGFFSNHEDKISTKHKLLGQGIKQGIFILLQYLSLNNHEKSSLSLYEIFQIEQINPIMGMSNVKFSTYTGLIYTALLSPEKTDTLLASTIALESSELLKNHLLQSDYSESISDFYECFSYIFIYNSMHKLLK